MKIQLIQGKIRYFGLVDWWLSTFTEAERFMINEAYNPLGLPRNVLVKGKIVNSEEKLIQFLTGWAGWIDEKDWKIAVRILDRAEKSINSRTDVLDHHFFLSEKARICFKAKENPGCLEQAAMACAQMIKMAPMTSAAFKKEYPNSPLPGHQGYETMIKIYEQKEDFSAIVKICSEAKAQGWVGNWDEINQRFQQIALMWPEIVSVIKACPGIQQTKLYTELSCFSRDLISYVLYNAGTKGSISRVKKGRTYELFPISEVGWPCPECNASIKPTQGSTVCCLSCGSTFEVER